MRRLWWRMLTTIAIAMLAGCEPNQPVQPEATESKSVPPAAAPDDLTGSEQAVEVTEGTNMSLDWHDGQLVISVQGVLFVLPDTGGPAQAITDQYQDAREPAFSPDGSSVVYHGYRNGNWDIWRVGVSGGTPEELTSDAFDDREPQFAPAGDRVFFSSDRGGNYDIWSLAFTDGSLTQHTFSSNNEHSPAVSPDGGTIAYVMSVNRAQSEVHVLAEDGSSEVVASEAGAISGVSWQRDGLALSYQVFSRTSAGSATAQKLVNLDGSSSQTLSDEGSDVFPFRAAWLADGSSFFTADGRVKRWSAQTIEDVPFSVTFTLNRVPYQRQQRDHDSNGTERALGLVGPAISPDGSQVVFSALADLWLWTPSSQTLTQLTDDTAAEFSPSWSHDGGRIVYTSDKRGKTELWIHSLNTDSTDVVELSANGVANPTWSPDGKSIAAFLEVPNNPLGAQLTVVNLDDGATRAVNRPIPAQPVSWSRDGRYLAAAALAPYSSRYREGVYQLEITDLEGGDTTSVIPRAHQNMLDAVLAPHAQTMTYVQGGTLWQAGLSEDFTAIGEPVPLTSILTDNPSWSAGGEYLVFMSADRMKRLHVASGDIVDITPELSWRRAQPVDTWTLRVGRLFDGVNPEYRENVDIRISGNRIVAIDPADGVLGESDFDASDRSVIPGLFEMHAHMGTLSEAQGRTWLAYGVTTVRDPGSNPYLAKARQESWDSGRQIGPRTHVTGYLADGNRVYYSIAEGIVSDEHLELALERTDALELDFIKTYVRLSDHWQARVIEFAHARGIPVSSHELFPAVAVGMDHVEHISGTSRRGYQPKVSALGYSYGDVVDLLSQSGMGITATAVLPGFSVVVGNAPDYFTTPQFETFYGAGARQGYVAMASRFGASAGATAAANGKLLRELTQRDALLVTGTDSPFVPYGAGLHAELRLYALAGLSPFEVLRSASYKSALAAGVADDLGTLAPGKLADLVVVDGDPLADIADADNVVMTVKNGRVYSLDELLTPAVE